MVVSSKKETKRKNRSFLGGQETETKNEPVEFFLSFTSFFGGGSQEKETCFEWFVKLKRTRKERAVFFGGQQTETKNEPAEFFWSLTFFRGVVFSRIGYLLFLMVNQVKGNQTRTVPFWMVKKQKPRTNQLVF